MDNSTFDSIYTASREKAHRAAYYILRKSAEITNPEDLAEDVLQEVFLRAHQFIEEGTEIGEGWIVTAARKKALSVRRDIQAQAKTCSASCDDLISGDDGQPIRRVDTMTSSSSSRRVDPRLAAMRSAMATLNDTLRIPLERVYVDGWSCEAVAFDLGISPAVVRKRVQRGRDQIADLLTGNSMKVAA